MAECIEPGCDRGAIARGLCQRHYDRLRYRRELPALLPKPTTEERFWAKVDKNGPLHPRLGTRCWLWTAGVDKDGYGEFFARKGHRAHRYSYELGTGMFWTWFENLQIDHKCHNPGCVRPTHLRAVTTKQNMENLLGAYSNSRSGALGVAWNKNTERWIARVGHNGDRIQVGTFTDLAEAAAAVKAKRLELFTHNDLDRSG